MVSDLSFRVLLAGIRNMGACLCPRCLVKKDQVHKLGLPMDRILRMTSQRNDDANLRTKIASAKRLIYDKGYVVDSKVVDEMLKGESLVPNTVRTYPIPNNFNTYSPPRRMLSLFAFSHSVSNYLSFLWST